MQGGVILFRGSGADARRYLESDRLTADDYYLADSDALAHMTVVGHDGSEVVDSALDAQQYAAWVEWNDPFTHESRGVPRLTGDGRKGSPRFAEMVVNVPKSVSIAVALHPDVSEALDEAQAHAAGEIRSWLGQNSVTRVGQRGAQEYVPVERLETVSVVHRTSRAGDPHRHVHFQIGTRVWAAGKWRGLDTGALFKQQGMIRALGTSVLAAHPKLAQTLADHGLTLDPVSGEVSELEQYNHAMSKRGAQVAEHLEHIETEWRIANPGREPGPVVTARWQALAWATDRPRKTEGHVPDEAAWLTELRDLGYTPADEQAVSIDAPELADLSTETVARRALDRCAAEASTWTPYTVREHVHSIVTEYGVRATPAEISEFGELTTQLALESCLSVLPPEYAKVDQVAHLTTVQVIAVEQELRERMQQRAAVDQAEHPNVDRLAERTGLDDGQKTAAAAVASTDQLVVVEGAAGAGKTTMLGVAIEAAEQAGRQTRVVTPTLKAAQVAETELEVSAHSVAKLVHANGWRWNRDGVWTRLAVGDADPKTGSIYEGPDAASTLTAGERIVVDEAGMLDQDTARALFTIADEAGATVALVGDRAQLAAVGRGGVLDMAAAISETVYDMDEVHRFRLASGDPDIVYAALTVDLRNGRDPDDLFTRLQEMGLVTVHESAEDAQRAIAAAQGEAITVATNQEARELNERIRSARIARGEVVDETTATGNDGAPMGVGDVIQTRHNDAELGVTNRATWIVQDVLEDGSVRVVPTDSGRKHVVSVELPAEYVAGHAHLAYASTAYGVQGTTVNESHTLLSESVSAAGVYVGMTRGRALNQLHIVAEDDADARAQFVDALARDRADRGLAEGTKQAQEAVAGIDPQGPAAQVAEARLMMLAKAKQHEEAAAGYEAARERYERLAAEHAGPMEEARAAVERAEGNVTDVRVEVVEDLTQQAVDDARARFEALDRRGVAAFEVQEAGRFGRRAAERAHAEAEAEVRRHAEHFDTRWQSVPKSEDTVNSWARTAATARAEVDPRVLAAVDQAEQARAAAAELRTEQERERKAVAQQATGDPRFSGDPARRAELLAVRHEEQGQRLSQEADLLGRMTSADALRRIEDERERQEELRRDMYERPAQPGQEERPEQSRTQSLS